MIGAVGIVIIGFVFNLNGIRAALNTCDKNQECVPFSQCHIEDPSAFLYPCHSGLNLVCCPSGLYDPASISLDNRKTALFPVNCGITTITNKITGGQDADLGQFPWMSLLGYTQRRTNHTQFLCGGSIITEKYVLTAAHCLMLDERLELHLVRFGEHNLLTEIDCVKTTEGTNCADRHVDVHIDKTLSHPGFERQKLHNDIALIKVQEKITFTEYIRPICLPFELTISSSFFGSRRFLVSGWGKTNSANLGGTTNLQFASVRIWPQDICSRSVPSAVQPIRDTQICANGNNTEDACKGDSGGPLVNSTRNKLGEQRFTQVGIVSYASSLTCGNAKLPTVYTRIDKYLQWIMDNVV